MTYVAECHGFKSLVPTKTAANFSLGGVVRLLDLALTPIPYLQG